MNDALIVSNVITWAILLGIIVAVLALARQIGVLHERLKPVGALSLGKVIKTGEPAPRFVLPSLTGGSVSIGGRAPLSQSTLLFFLSPTCPVCKLLLPVLKSVQECEQGWLRLVLASDGKEGEHLEFIKKHSLEDLPYVNSTEVGLAFQIAKLPYGVLIDADGTVVTHGLVNNREHLESLFEAKALGYASMQQFQRSEAHA